MSKLHLICALLLYAAGANGQSNFYGSAFGLLLEKGPAEARFTPILAVEAGVELPFDGSSLDVAGNVALGSLLGTTATLGVEALWHLNLRDGKTGDSWTPGIGAGLALDFGDSIYFASTAMDAPVIPQGYFGIAIKPLSFRNDGWRWSFLDMRLYAGYSGGFTLRPSLSIFSLAWTPAEAASAGTAFARAAPKISIGLSDGATVALVGNFMIPEIDVVAPRIDIRFAGFEAATGFEKMAILGYQIDGYQLFAEALYSPDLGAWQPGIGLGFLYETISLQGNYDTDLMALYCVVKPLQYSIPLASGFNVSLSALELRYSPLYSSGKIKVNDQGGFFAQLTLLRAGLRFAIDAGEAR